jgi:tRNA (guanine-N7-)-methyltransferase
MSEPPCLTDFEVERATAAESYGELRRYRRADLERRLVPILSDFRPFVWEIGCGHGHFLTAYAQTYPGQTCIGIDIASDRIERATRKRDRARLANLHFIRAEAGLFFEALPAAIRFSSVFILFPDPWPKLRHHKHRIMQPPFLQRLAGRMGEGGRLYFRTDYGPYFDETVQLLSRLPQWAILKEPWPFEHASVFQNRAAGHDSLVAQVRGSLP